MSNINMTSKSFSGKWIVATKDQKHFITLKNPQNGILDLESLLPSSPTDSQYFNTYGNIDSAFWFQASNWKYVTYNASSGQYQATKQRDESFCTFNLETVSDGEYRIVDLTDSETHYYLNADGGNLGRIIKEAYPPDSTIFITKMITHGLEFLQDSNAMGANLTGVYLAQEDLHDITFSGADLSYAILKNANLRGTVFQGATIANADFSDCIFDNVIFSGVKGDRANFQSITLGDNTDFSGAVINYAQFENITVQGKPSANNLTANNAVFNNSNLTGLVCNGSTLKNTQFINVNLSNTQMGNSNFEGSTLTQVNFQGASLQTSVFNNVTMARANFKNADITRAIFQKANMTSVQLSEANGISYIDITGASMMGAIMNRLDLTTVKIDSDTNFTQAQMESVNLTSQNLNGVNFLRTNLKQAKLDHTSLEGAVLVGANLNFASITGNVSFINANLSNASLENVDLSGAQMGPLKQVANLSCEHISDLNQQTVPEILQQNSILKSKQPSKVTVRQVGQHWLVENDNETLLIEKVGAQLQVSQVEETSNGAILANAYMPNAKLTGANLYAVDMSGVNWYGSDARADNANLEQANLSNANLATMNFTQAKMYGVNLSFANVIQTNFRKALLSPTQGLKATSFAFASMQGADFTDAHIGSANLTNAAVSLEIDGKVNVPLFQISADFSETLNNGSISEKLKTAFSDNGYPLIDNPHVTVIEHGQSWSIDNINSDPSVLQTGYGKFFLSAKNEAGEDFIMIYGDSPFLIKRTNSDNELVTIQTAFGATILPKGVLTNDVTCPSGLKYGMLNDSLSYEYLMTAGLPPHPPRCIPSPTTWC